MKRHYHRTKYAKLLRWIAPGCAVLLTGLRFWILKTAFDENGLLPPGSLALPLTILAAALVFGLLLVLSLRLNRIPGTEESFTSRPNWVPSKLAAAELVLMGSVLTLLDGQHPLSVGGLVVTLVGIAAPFFMVWTALREERSSAFFWVRLVPALYAGASLVLRFQTWTQEPAVIHIAPSLLAWTCCMVAMMLLTGFPLRVGHRRSTVLFGLSAGIFTCMTVPDCAVSGRISRPDLLILMGLSVWCVTYALELLRKRSQREHKKETDSSGETLPVFGVRPQSRESADADFSAVAEQSRSLHSPDQSGPDEG